MWDDFVNLVRVCPLHIIRRNHSKTFLSINIKKTKLVQGHFVLISGFWQFRQVFIHYIMSILMCVNKQVATFIKQSLGNYSSRQLVPKKNKPEKYTFIATNNWIVLAARSSVKYFFPWRRKEEEKQLQSVLFFRQT